MKERRSEIRIPLISERATLKLLDDSYMNKNLRDISSKGVFIYSEELLLPNTPIEVTFELPAGLGLLKLKGKVKFVNWASTKKKLKKDLGFSCVFDAMTKSHTQILSAYCVYLRNKQISVVATRILNEMNKGRTFI